MEGSPPPGPPNPALPYREDCWSDGATSSLIEAWGVRYLELNRGHIRQKHWQEVADAVNSRPGAARRPSRTDVQCKNRIDTLKKKYKAERARVSASSASRWPFYTRLDTLVGPSSAAPKPPPLALPLPLHLRGKRPAVALPVDDSLFRRSYSAAAAGQEEADSDSSRPSNSSRERSARGRREGGGEGIRQLAREIVRFGEVYERVERAKQRQMMELEKQRMEFAKGLEYQRMQIFVDSQVQLQKIKRSK